MDILLDENEQELSNILIVKDTDGRIALVIGLLVTVFFENQLTRKVREAVASVAEDYISQVRGNLRWAIPLNVNQERRIDAGQVKFPSEWLPDHPDGESWNFAFHGGEGAGAASGFHIHAFGSKPYDDGGLGFLHLSFPLLWFAEHAETFPEYVVKICRQIRPLSGYGGIGVLEPYDGYAQSKFQPIVREFAERFPGLEIEDRAGHTNHLRTGIKGVNWLTILGDPWVKEMGGLDYLRVRLGEEFGLYPYDGGLMIQAGPKPQIGDVQADRWPRLYVTLAKVLKKIQIKNHYPFHFGGPGRRMNHANTNAWLRRFDDK